MREPAPGIRPVDMPVVPIGAASRSSTSTSAASLTGREPGAQPASAGADHGYRNGPVEAGVLGRQYAHQAVRIMVCTRAAR